MSYLIRMAMRNLLRNKRRSSLAFLSVALSVLLCVVMQGLMGGYLDSLVKNYTKDDTGHIRITTREFVGRAEFLPVDTLIRDPRAVEARIESDPKLRSKIALMTQRITFGVLLEHDGKNKAATAIAGDPAVERHLLYLQRSIEPGGRYISGPNETIVGASLAADLDLSLGDRLKVVTTASDGSLQLTEPRIVGIFKTGIGSLDDRVFQLPLADAKRFLRTDGGAQEILIMLKNYREADSVAREITALLRDPRLAVVPWTAIGDYAKLADLQQRIFNIMLALVLFLGAFIITNIMTMVVLERKREIGILKSMGMSRRETLVLFLWEGIFLGFVGSLIGAVFGFALNIVLHFQGVDFGGSLQSVDLPLDNVIHWTLDPGFAVAVVVLASAIAGIVSVVPSLRAARLSAVEAMKSA